MTLRRRARRGFVCQWPINQGKIDYTLYSLRVCSPGSSSSESARGSTVDMECHASWKSNLVKQNVDRYMKNSLCKKDLSWGGKLGMLDRLRGLDDNFWGVSTALGSRTLASVKARYLWVGEIERDLLGRDCGSSKTYASNLNMMVIEHKADEHLHSGDGDLAPSDSSFRKEGSGCFPVYG